jgi:rubrerythrin
VSSNISQNYPYSSETDAERAAAVAATFAAHDGLEARIAESSTALEPPADDGTGAPARRWTWVCPACIEGRLHIAGYQLDGHGLVAVCDRCGRDFRR